MNEHEAVQYLREIRLIADEPARVSPLTGGVSSNIYLVETSHCRWVVKQALARLRVKDDWQCDPARSLNEYEALRYAQAQFPQAVPRTVHVDCDRNLFVMEYLGEEFAQWKQQLLSGVVETRVAVQAATLLAQLHAGSWFNDDVAKRFSKIDDFFSLRIAPYLLTAADRNPVLRPVLTAEAKRLRESAIALAHGDWSSKNILTNGKRIVVLDWEVACFSDPAFDVAFFLNLIYLKSLYRRIDLDKYIELIGAFQAVYRQLNPHYSRELEKRIVRLTLMLMLARIDGKSPAEYLTQVHDRQLVRQFVHASLLDQIDSPAEFDRCWRDALRKS